MVCGGQNTTCLHHKSVYQSNGLEAGRIHTHTDTHSHTHNHHIISTRNQLQQFQTDTICGWFQALSVFCLPSVISQSSKVKRLLFSDDVNINHGNSFAKQNLLAAFQEAIQQTRGPPKVNL